MPLQKMFPLVKLLQKLSKFNVEDVNHEGRKENENG